MGLDVDVIPVRRALLSAADRTGLAGLARGLAAFGVEILSTGGSAAHLREAGIRVVDVAAVTGVPEMLDGRVKTLHPKIHAALLADRDLPSHRGDLERQGIAPIDLVAVNLYAFEATAARAGVSREDVIEQIDVGGPAMIRAAAKNHRHVVVLTSPGRYADVLEAMEDHRGAVPRALAGELAGEAFRRTAEYDREIALWFTRAVSGPAGREPPAAGLALPARMRLDLEKSADLRYGENPHQAGALYRDAGGPDDAVPLRRLGGKDLSYTNYLDMDAAVRLLGEFEEPAAVIIKHLTPCGLGFGATPEAAYARALAADPLSAFGGTAGVNRPCDAGLARRLVGTFLELALAPSFSPEALDILGSKKNLRIIEMKPLPGGRPGLALRTIVAGHLVQTPDPPGPPPEFSIVTRRPPTEAETRALHAAWRIVKHVKSNAIVLADETGLVGVGAGQTSRIDALHEAVRKAGRGVGMKAGVVLASDAFFPFPDSIEAAHEAGVAAIVQPGGSVRDGDSIAAADERGMAMVFTGRRVFLH